MKLNRRSFLGLLPFLPAGLKAAVKPRADFQPMSEPSGKVYYMDIIVRTGADLKFTWLVEGTLETVLENHWESFINFPGRINPVTQCWEMDLPTDDFGVAASGATLNANSIDYYCNVRQSVVPLVTLKDYEEHKHEPAQFGYAVQYGEPCVYLGFGPMRARPEIYHLNYCIFSLRS